MAWWAMRLLRWPGHLLRRHSKSELRMLMRRIGLLFTAIGCVLLVPNAAVAQLADPAQPTLVAPAHSCCTIPQGTTIAIEIREAIDSKSALAGHRFPIALKEPVTIDGSIVIPAGTIGGGEIVHVAKARAMGKAGELILAARYLELNGQQIPLRTFRFGGVGKDNRNVTFAATVFVGLPGLAISGGNIRVEAGTVASAKIAADVEIVSERVSSNPNVSIASEPPTKQGE